MRVAYFLLGALALIAACNANKDVLNLGSPSYNGKLLAQEVLAKKYRWLSKVNALFVFRTREGGAIKRILASNSLNNGAIVKVVEGGIDKNFVKLEFTSARNRGFNFTVSIFGEYENRPKRNPSSLIFSKK